MEGALCAASEFAPGRDDVSLGTAAALQFPATRTSSANWPGREA